MDPIDLDSLAMQIPDGCRLAVPKDDTGASIAATLALIRRNVRDLHLVCLPVSGLQADLLIGAGGVATIETSGVTLGEHGAAPRFSAAIRTGSIRIIDGTCPAIYAGMQAAQKGIPFMPLRGILGSDLLLHRTDWRVIDNPFDADDPIVAIAAIRPDVALFHAQAADRFGNVFLGRDRDGLLLAHAADRCYVTVERLVDGNLLADPARAGSVLPAMYVDGVSLAPKAAWPLYFGTEYPADHAWLARYAREARTAEGFDAWLQDCIAHMSGLRTESA